MKEHIGFFFCLNNDNDHGGLNVDLGASLHLPDRVPRA